MTSPAPSSISSWTRTRRAASSGCTGSSSRATYRAIRTRTATRRPRRSRLAVSSSSRTPGPGTAKTIPAARTRTAIALAPFLEKKGHRMVSDDVLTQRLVHLVDEQRRNELMIIYMEDLAAMKLTAKDLAPGGRAAAQWDDIAKGLLERALKGMEIAR